MSNYAISLKRTSLLLAALAFTAVLMAVNFASFFSARADAAQLTFRSLSLNSSLDGTETSGLADSETNGSNTTHTFSFRMPTAVTVEAVLFKYCTTAIGGCTAPTGMSAEASTLTSETFSTVFANDTTSLQSEDIECVNDVGSDGRANCIGITQATGASEAAAPTTHTIVFGGIRNPTSIGTFFVRISIFGVDDYTSLQHEGTVASATTEGIAITSRVVETLGFSTTANITDDSGASGLGDPGLNCAPLTGSGAMTLGDPDEGTLSIALTYDQYSAFRLYTNAANGVVVAYDGETLRKGTDDIDEIGAAAESINGANIGTEQFGLAVDGVIGGNAAASVESSNDTFDFTFANNTADFNGGPGEVSIAAAYQNGDGLITDPDPEFAFQAGAKRTVATGTAYVDCVTVPVRYAANISALTPAGTYTTTIVYFALPTY